MLADDLKLNLPIYSSDDNVRLQSDSDKFYTWCSSYGLSVNVNKMFINLVYTLKHKYKIPI